MPESPSSPIPYPSPPLAQKGKPGLDLKPPFWIVLGVFLGDLLWILPIHVGGMPLTVVVSLAARGIGWFFLERARRSGRVQAWHWMLAGGGSLLSALAVFGLLYAATDSDVFAVLAGILGMTGLAGGLIAVIVMLVVAATQRSDSAAVVGVPRGQMVSPIVGYSAEGQPIYGPPVFMESRNTDTNVFAILTLVFGILGGLLGIVFGHIALSQIRRTGEQGRGMAVAGLVLGYFFLAGWIIFLIALADSGL
ncbi:DUF4190 domain-containing protein [Rhodococcus marinonascens]|uniref:DUF4190 domain-containing protein n=1 Tax=Rhodococcus marinonascens TaxID=38311 RepID=UPI000AB68E29|nr:DUF4190 domain-containing protein [Rhodococcus marinonascens]